MLPFSIFSSKEKNIVQFIFPLFLQSIMAELNDFLYLFLDRECHREFSSASK